MLGRIGQDMSRCELKPVSVNEDRYSRNELDDMKKGIEYFYEFKEKLSKLHPVVMDAIDNLLQRQRY